jgi:hypothetical protein
LDIPKKCRLVAGCADSVVDPVRRQDARGLIQQKPAMGVENAFQPIGRSVLSEGDHHARLAHAGRAGQHDPPTPAGNGIHDLLAPAKLVLPEITWPREVAHLLRLHLIVDVKRGLSGSRGWRGCLDANGLFVACASGAQNDR